VTALKHLDEEQQDAFKKRLGIEGRTDWWKPETVWQGLPNAINAIVKVKAYTPSLTLIS
jgi:hypothetical protein